MAAASVLIQPLALYAWAALMNGEAEKAQTIIDGIGYFDYCEDAEHGLLMDF